MSEKSQEQVNEIDEQLVSYLDQELEPEEMARVEQQLRVDPDYQTRLRELERAWDMLDSLPRVHVEDDFTRSTVAMVAMTAAKEAETTDFEVKKNRKGWWVAFAGMIVTAAIGYFAVFYAMGSPNRKLLKDLPVIEHVDDYRYVESVEFLELLDQEGLFAAEESEDAI